MNKEKNTEINEEKEEDYTAMAMNLGMCIWYSNRNCNR